MSKEHLLCYIRRNSLTSWKLDSLERGTRNRPQLSFGSNDPNFARFAKKGNVLWIVGGSSDAPPSLEARIEIAGELHQEKEWDCEIRGSVKGSAFFGLNDASSALMQLVFKNSTSLWSLRDKHSSTEWNSGYGRDLQSVRRLALPDERINRHRSAGAKSLEEVAIRAIDRSVFISWKHSDNNQKRRRFLKALTCQLAKCGFSVWWDQTALTDVRIVDEYSADRRVEMMTRLLRQGVSQTTAVLALWTEGYGTASQDKTPNWTRNEWHVRDAARIAMVPGEFARKSLIANPDRVISISLNPSVSEAPSIARRFKQVYDSL